MGVIFRVAGPDPGFPIIMKIPRLGPGEPGESVITYEVEEMMLGALTGPHVPRFVAAGDVTKQAYLVMEYVEGAFAREVDGRRTPAARRGDPDRRGPRERRPCASTCRTPSTWT